MVTPPPSLFLEPWVQTLCHPGSLSLSPPGLLAQSRGQRRGQCWGAHTQWVTDFDLGSWTAQGDGDLLQAGVKGNLPRVLALLLVVCGQQVHLGGLDS